MGLFDTFGSRKTIEELEEERERNDAEISVVKQRVMLKELKARGQELDNFKDENGKPVWSRIANWLKTH